MRKYQWACYSLGFVQTRLGEVPPKLQFAHAKLDAENTRTTHLHAARQEIGGSAKGYHLSVFLPMNY